MAAVLAWSCVARVRRSSCRTRSSSMRGRACLRTASPRASCRGTCSKVALTIKPNTNPNPNLALSLTSPNYPEPNPNPNEVTAAPPSAPDRAPRPPPGPTPPGATWMATVGLSSRLWSAGNGCPSIGPWAPTSRHMTRPCRTAWEPRIDNKPMSLTPARKLNLTLALTLTLALALTLTLAIALALTRTLARREEEACQGRPGRGLCAAGGRCPHLARAPARRARAP